MPVSTANLGIPQGIINLIQDRTLERVFHDALYPRLLYRSEAIAEMWQANLGEQMVFTRAGLMDPDETPLVPGNDPGLGTYPFEQWRAQANQYGKSIDTHMPTSYVSLAPIFLRNIMQLGLQAGQTMNRLARNPLYRAYEGGNTLTTAVAGPGATSVDVANLNGFTEQIANAAISPVSPANPLDVTFTSAAPVAPNQVVGFSPADPTDPFGPGTLLLANPLGGAGLAARDGVLARTRSDVYRVGGAATVDGIAPGNVLQLQDVINVVAQMRAQNVPPCADGYYHVHVSPQAEAQLFSDNQFQRLYNSLPDSAAYRDLAIGQLVGCRFYRDVENPNRQNSGALVATGGDSQSSGSIGGEVVNFGGTNIERAIVIGGGALYEKYLDESKFITEAGVTGKIGEFNVINNGVAIMTQRIRMIMRAPLDRLQQVVSTSWSWSGDFPVPSDAETGTPARYKRAVVIQHA